MIGFFTPRYVKNGREMLHAARKMLCYKRDLLQPHEVAMIEGRIQDLADAIQDRDPKKVENAADLLNHVFETHFPPRSHPELRENCEVVLVAFVIAIAIRSYFLQPFTIPTGSMQPTLNGIIVTQTESLPPNPLVRALDMAHYGRSYFNVVSKEDGKILSVSDVSWMWFFSYTEIQCEKQTLYVPAPSSSVIERFQLRRYMDEFDKAGRLVYKGQPLRAGEVVARGYADTGDHVFVNKVAYNFRKPRRGEVFVFGTTNIERIQTPDGNSQYYIKRLAGVPGDTLRIDAPKLFINGQLASGSAFERVMAGTYEDPVDGYRGYSNPRVGYPDPLDIHNPINLLTPTSTVLIPEKSYFALGDNSYNSADSRYWGFVPEENLMGCGMFVYWPFTKHWGFIK